MNFTAINRVEIVNGGALVPATAITTAITAYQIDEATHQPDTTAPLTAVTQIITAGTGTSWGNFVETTSTDKYNVFFFFSASSVDVTASTFQILSGPVEFSDKIYRLEESTSSHVETNIYALAMSFPERYESSAGSDNYRVAVDIKTNDPETHLPKILTVTHNYCKASEQFPQQ